MGNVKNPITTDEALMGRSTNDIIKVNYETEHPTVSARDLYDSLSGEGGAKGTERFSKWFDRYCGYGFMEGEDYSNPYQKLRVQIEGNREVQREVEDYDLSIDMAKQICMLQKTERGKKIRQYLIDLDKAWNTPERVMARALEIAHKTIEDMKKENTALLEDNETMRPKAEYFDELIERNLLTSFRTTAKEFGVKEGMFIGWLLDNKYIYRDQKNKICPYATQKTEGLFEVREYKSKYSDHAGTQTLITPKGRETFRILMKI